MGDFAKPLGENCVEKKMGFWWGFVCQVFFFLVGTGLAKMSNRFVRSNFDS